MEYEIYPLSLDRMNDFLSFFDNDAFKDHEEWDGCYCLIYHIRDENSSNFSGEKVKRRKIAIELIKEKKLRGYLAYLNGKVVGWCNTSDKESYPYYVSDEKLMDKNEANKKIKSIVCFTVDPKMRSKGIATQLLIKIYNDAKVEEYDFIECYPIKNEQDYFGNFTGPLKMYQKFGFELHKELEDRYIYRKYLR